MAAVAAGLGHETLYRGCTLSESAIGLQLFLPGDFTETFPVSPIVALRSNIEGLILACIATCASVYQAHQLHLYATGLDAQGHVTSSPQVKMPLYVLDSKQT